jgi:hypothetical protein
MKKEKNKIFNTETGRHGLGHSKFKIQNFKFLFWCLFASVAALSLTSCTGIARDMGLEEVPDYQQRSGITGTADQPAVLDPFKSYDLVMAADECRFFQMKVPADWYWKVFLTAANPDQSRSGKLRAQILQSDPPWGALRATSFEKEFDLTREGDQGALAVVNKGDTRVAIMKFCQQGAPLHITIQSQVSAMNDPFGPPAIPTPTGD